MVMAYGKKRKIIFIAIGVLIVVALGSLAGWFLLKSTADSPLPQSITSEVNFPLYYPKTLPKGYSLKNESVTGSTKTVYYTLVNGMSEQDITVTIQATPGSFDASKIIGSNPIPTTILPVGTLYNLSTGETSSYMLNTGKSLIFLTSPSILEGSTISSLCESLTEIQ